MTPQEAQASAVEAAGCDDFGADGWQEGLAFSLDAFGRMPLTDEAREQALGKIVHDLTNRLKIEQWYKDHPETDAEEIEGPVLVCGLPRTGTTATVGIMATDPRYRFLRMWEATSPVPPPVTGEEDEDPRAVAWRAQMADRDQARHIADPDGPEEDQVMLAPLDMRGYHGAYPMPDDYIDWWMDADFTSTFAYLRRALKLLQSRRGPKLWLLKSPVHLFRLETFAAEFPDAKFIWTHRDPAKVIPSVSSVQYALNAERCVEGALDKQEYGHKFLRFWKAGLERGLAARAAIGEDRFIDVWNQDVVNHPARAFRKIYDRLGFDITPAFDQGIADYSARNAKGVHGEHRYSAEEYGTSREEIRAAFSGYIQRFGL